MTKNKKIKLLIDDNKRLIEENKKLHQQNNEEISKKMIAEMERYSDVVDKLYQKYKELNQLKLAVIKNHWKYQWMLAKVKIRKLAACINAKIGE